jgi:DNA invertase Pin-like site-specific DNA recombinase
MNNSAISYLRFSSSKQKKGASYDRQIEATEKFCAQNNLILIDQIEDKGISGWNEDNLEETAALGKLIKLIELGQIKKGTTLIVENLDRITRANLTKAVNLITTILLSGVDIVTTMDGKRYRQDSDQVDIMFAIFYLTRGNEESETKSKRVKQAWQKKRQLINEGKFVKLTQHPNWLKVENNKYVENEEATKLVKRIFEMYISGIGSHLISKKLNKEGSPPFSRTGKRFTFSSIERLLKNPAVIGQCEVVSPPKENYYPRIISDGVWYQAQSMRKKNNHFKGTRNDSKKVNFMGGLLFCKTCDSGLVRYSCGKNGKRYHYLVCSAAKYGEHKMVLFDYDKIQKSFLMAMYKSNFLNNFLDSKKNDLRNHKIESLNGKLIELKSRIENVCTSIKETNSKHLNLMLISLEAEEAEIENQIAEENKLIYDYEYNSSTQDLFVATVYKHIDENPYRIRIRNFFRSTIEGAVVFKESSLGGTVIHIILKNALDKITITLMDETNNCPAILVNNKAVAASFYEGTRWIDLESKSFDLDPFFLKGFIVYDQNGKPKGFNETALNYFLENSKLNKGPFKYFDS